VNIEKIMYLLKVCEWKNITRAAQELFVSQQALSKAIQSVEKELGVTLFYRSSRGLELTASGERFYETFLPLAQQYHSLVQEFRETAVGKVRLGLSGGVLRRLGVTLLDDFQKAHPQIELTVQPGSDGEQVSAVLSGECELALSPPPVGFNSKNLSFIEVWSEPIYIVVRKDHPLAAKSHVCVQEMEGMPIIRGDSDDYTYRATAAACHNAGFQPTFVDGFEEVELLKETAVLTGSIFVCPQLYTKYLPQNSALVRILDPILVLKEGFIQRKDIQLSAPVQALISYVKEHAARP